MTDSNRREFHRIACVPVPCIVEADGCRVECELLDESIGGFRIIGIDPLMLDQDQPMSIEHRDEVMNVYCANVSRTDEGKFSIGLEREDVRSQNDDPAPTGTLINPYVHIGKGVGVLCRLVEIKSPEDVVVEVLGKKRFSVHANRVTPLLRVERKAELTALDSIDWLAEIYSSASLDETISPTVDAIVDFEFGRRR